MSGGREELTELDKLKELRRMLVQLENDKAKNSELTAKEEQLDGQIETLEKQLSDKIAMISKTRCVELASAYDEQIDKTKARFRKVRTKKDKQKNSKISERIQSETAQMREERVQLYDEIKKQYKESKIPRFLNNRFVHALHIPQSIGDVLIIVLTLAVVLFFIPCGVYYAAFRPKAVFLVVIYIVTILFFGGIYIAVNRTTKEKHPQTFEKIKTLRRKLNANRKNIRGKERAIRKDKDESSYGLDKFNNELHELEVELENIGEEKKKALKKFESETRASIAEELTAEYAKELGPLRVLHEKVYDEQRKIEENIKNLSMRLTKEYNSYLGKENMDIVMVDALVEIMENGEAVTIRDAIEIYSRKTREMQEENQA